MYIGDETKTLDFSSIEYFANDRWKDLFNICIFDRRISINLEIG